MPDGRDDPNERRTVFGFSHGPLGREQPSPPPLPPFAGGDRDETQQDDPAPEAQETSRDSGSPSTVPTNPTLQTTPESDVPAAVDSALGAGTTPIPGQVFLDRYMVVRRIGEGGMGTVWLVRHLELDSERALKLIVSGIAMDAEVRTRFRREARIMDRLSHPNSVRVYDVRLGKGTAFIEMEYVRGESLNTLMRPREPMPLDQVVDLVDQLCDVLQAANDEGIIHRDLKPSNLMLVDSKVPGKKVLKLLDFGIAKFRDGGDPDDLTTQTGLFMGTATYSSPEQIRGDAIDTRSDLYSVGVLLFELLTGYRPFDGPSHAQIASHLTTLPPSFADRNPNVDVSYEIEEVVRSCLAKSPADRPQTPRELAERFHSALESSQFDEHDAAAYDGWQVNQEPQSGYPKSTSWDQNDSDLFAGTAVADGKAALDATKIPTRRRPWRIAFLAAGIAGCLVVALVIVFGKRGSSPKPVNPPREAERAPIERPPLIEAQIARWASQGFTIDPQGGESAHGWPKVLAAADGNQFQLDSSGLYLPRGYKPGPNGGSHDQKPRMLVRDDGTRFLRLEGGTFLMGCLPEDNGSGSDEDPNKPAHPVTLSSFYMQETEVTNDEIKRYFRGSVPAQAAEWKNKFDQATVKIGDLAVKHPAVNLTHETAENYARRQGGRLPTEAQWEFAARSRGKDILYVWDFAGVRGEPVGSMAHIDNIGSNAVPTVPVGSMPGDVTAEGIKDLAGNVRELCRDVRKPYTKSSDAVDDPQFPPPASQTQASMVVRGGSFGRSPEMVQTTNRGESLQRDASAGDVGLRLVLELPELPDTSATTLTTEPAAPTSR